MTDLLQVMRQQVNRIRQHLIAKLNHGMKWYIIVFAEFKKDALAADGTMIEQKREDYISSQTFTAYNQTDIDMDLPTAYKDLFTKFDEQERQGSGWYLSKIIQIEVHTATLSPLKASSYIELPKKVKRTKAVLNIKNKDNMCFIWSVLAHLHPIDKDANTVIKYQAFLHQLNGEGVDFPTPIHQIPDFEKKNNVSINVFVWEEKEMVPVQLSRHESETVINLLLISQDDNMHYCLIRHFSRLMNYRTKHTCKVFYCMNCLHGFCRQDLLDKHREVCNKHKAQRLSFPEDTTVKFKSIAKQQRVPFCIYADFECCTVKQEGDKYQHHEPNSFAYKVVNEYEQCDPVLYRGDNVFETFFDHMNKKRNRIVKRSEKTEPIVMTPDDEKYFDEATDCHICHELMGADRVRGHDHVSGKYRGAAHSECNLQFRLRKSQQDEKDSCYIPVFFHNLRGYDSHILMQSIGKYKDLNLKVIANTMEKYISFSMGNLKFIDSYQFMGASLQKLVTNLAVEGKDKFQNMTAHFQDSEQQDLLLRKGVYPYDYVDDASKFANITSSERRLLQSIARSRNQ